MTAERNEAELEGSPEQVRQILRAGMAKALGIADEEVEVLIRLADRPLRPDTSMSLAIDPYGSATTNGRPVKLRQTESSPTFDPALSAVG